MSISSDGILGALFSSTQRKVLSLFFSEVERRLTMKDIIRVLASGSGAVQREIDRLSKSQLLIYEQIGRQKIYRANPNSPIYGELKKIIAKTAGVAERIRDTLNRRIDEEIELAFIYGSIAKGNDQAGSDIDLMVVANDLTLSTLYEVLEPLESDFGRRINLTLYTSKEWRSKLRAKSPFVTKVINGAKILLAGTFDDE